MGCFLAKKKGDSARKQGRPKLKLTPEQLVIATRLAGIGCTIKQIAHVLDVSQSTLDRRIAEDPKVSDALDKGRALAASKVMNAAFNMAISEKNPYMTTFWLRCRLGWTEPKDETPGDDPFNMNYSRPSRDVG